ncbi:cytochrome-c peroxidase [Nitrosophilus alvini]|uniref:cytochrome-c peroxidase n=1 Tax=Nitrosophilus alvini TaxID=2714855 RepID=UPI00190C586D|nr:cytochrome c peroxidase [Nitrosophilus alvini]
MNKKILAVVLFGIYLFASDMSIWLRPDYIPAPKENPLTKEKIELGKLLFFDPRLSRNDTVSCATCHIPYYYWTDRVPRAVGIEGRKGTRNTPTIVNGAYLHTFFWDARAESLEEQALGPIEAKAEMDISAEELVKKLKNIKGYVKLFEKAFPGIGITKETIAKAIASFERTVVSTESAFDRWVKGDQNAISEEAKEGFEIFRNKGKCISCHSGFNFTNESLNNIALGDSDPGVFAITKNPIWKGCFKTPTLRDVAETSPYFHDGSVHTLEEAVYICGNGGRYKDMKGRSPFFRDRGLSMDEVRKVVKFLETLTGKRPDIEIPYEFPQ